MHVVCDINRLSSDAINDRLGHRWVTVPSSTLNGSIWTCILLPLFVLKVFAPHDIFGTRIDVNIANRESPEFFRLTSRSLRF